MENIKRIGRTVFCLYHSVWDLQKNSLIYDLINEATKSQQLNYYGSIIDKWSLHTDMFKLFTDIGKSIEAAKEKIVK